MYLLGCFYRIVNCVLVRKINHAYRSNWQNEAREGRNPSKAGFQLSGVSWRQVFKPFLVIALAEFDFTLNEKRADRILGKKAVYCEPISELVQIGKLFLEYDVTSLPYEQTMRL